MIHRDSLSDSASNQTVVLSASASSEYWHHFVEDFQHVCESVNNEEEFGLLDSIPLSLTTDCEFFLDIGCELD